MRNTVTFLPEKHAKKIEVDKHMAVAIIPCGVFIWVLNPRLYIKKLEERPSTYMEIKNASHPNIIPENLVTHIIGFLVKICTQSKSN